MCGIIGYVGWRPAEPILVDGLRRLEYRGYDSAGVAIIGAEGLQIRKCTGQVSQLAELLKRQPAPGLMGIGHTRWATHGCASDANAHPQMGGDGAVAVVHNGVIDNYADLKQHLQAQGFVFRSQTDTEVIAHLIAAHLDGDLVEAVRRALSRLKGTYGLAVVSPRFPGLVVGARLGSPLVVGVGKKENYLASDPSALAARSDHIVYLEDRQLCVLTEQSWEILDVDLQPVPEEIQPGNGEAGVVSKGDFAHYMLKEIYEQPEVIARTMAGRFDESEASARFGGLNLDPKQLRDVERLVLTGCGTSYHAALVGEYLIEQFARLPVEVEYASEFRYRQPPLDRHTIVLGITQSGETADTLAALLEAKRRGQATLALCNVVGSSIAREADGGVYLHAGPEIGVASTKAFTAQITVLTLLALYLGRLRHLSHAAGSRIISELQGMPAIVRQTLQCHDIVQSIARKYYQASAFLYLGRQFLFPVALEGALKLKEISYLQAQGYPAAEMKHGPIAQVDADTPSVFLVPHCAVYDKVMSNLEEIKARGGPVIAVADEDDRQVAARADDVITVPGKPSAAGSQRYRLAGEGAGNPGQRPLAAAAAAAD